MIGSRNGTALIAVKSTARHILGCEVSGKTCDVTLSMACEIGIDHDAHRQQKAPEI